MPLIRCTKNGKPCYKFGKNGYPYPYKKNDPRSREEAKAQAYIQGKAIEASKNLISNRFT